MTRRERGYLAILERRRKHLAERIMRIQLTGGDSIEYDRQELGALNWLIAIARDEIEARDGVTV